MICDDVGIGASVMFYLADVAFSDRTAPFLVSHSTDTSGVDGTYSIAQYCTV